MMKKFIPYHKLSKKKKKEIDSEKRAAWNDYFDGSPAARIIPDKKKKSDKEICRRKDDCD